MNIKFPHPLYLPSVNRAFQAGWGGGDRSLAVELICMRCITLTWQVQLLPPSQGTIQGKWISILHRVYHSCFLLPSPLLFLFKHPPNLMNVGVIESFSDSLPESNVPSPLPASRCSESASRSVISTPRRLRQRRFFFNCLIAGSASHRSVTGC